MAKARFLNNINVSAAYCICARQYGAGESGADESVQNQIKGAGFSRQKGILGWLF
jgi:hypothetical protein